MKHTSNDGSFIGLGLGIERQMKRQQIKERFCCLGCCAISLLFGYLLFQAI